MATALLHVSRERLREKIESGEEFVLVDALAPMSYAASHLPGAIPASLHHDAHRAPGDEQRSAKPS